MIYLVGINKILLSNKVSLGKKGYKFFEDGKKVRTSCLMLPKMITYKRDFDETKFMYFLIKKIVEE